ncbi:pentapeptide repeat-containing protein [Nostoc sp. 'Lobaria pulmonaria (5183) cyanobiont']|uniref:pentapeptide repeat-containing protein n=1 Tax=Nostoc sp. 'Lobaria pulmonaria (5183) cyanobiont' TaxID=1618022 RepID=UPI002D7800E4|nr:pentapeptide repeat-containing protein [Nostoc sp. 'Lobaria pulmonaria (5183) cyanobiont']
MTPRVLKQTEINLLWQNLDSAKGKEYSLARIQALEKLVKAGESLASRDFRNTDLSSAKLRGADLRGADLSGAKLRNTDLRNTDLSSAKLSGADLSGADLSGADLRYAKNPTPEQVKSANSWKEAEYDEDFRTKLGLPPELAK